jgi:hypothetical protein
MIKSELVQRIAAQNPHLYRRDVENIVDTILNAVTAALARRDRVELRGFGVFSAENLGGLISRPELHAPQACHRSPISTASRAPLMKLSAIVVVAP